MPSRAGTLYLNEQRLRRALEGQGFKVADTRQGATITRSGEHVASWHHTEHTFGKSGEGSYRALIADLVKGGFDLDMIGTGNGRADAWRAERDELEAAMAAELAEHAATTAAADQLATAEADLAAVVRSLTPKQAEVYAAIKAEPGKLPREYAPTPDQAGAVVSLIAHLRRVNGLVTTTGTRKSCRIWPREDAPDDAAPVGPLTPNVQRGGSRNGPVRTRHVEPGDAVVRFRRMGEKATRLKRELEEIITAMVDAYAVQDPVEALTSLSDTSTYPQRTPTIASALTC
jgi:hypothetical protein